MSEEKLPQFKWVESTGWCMPSENIFDEFFRYPASQLLYPDDCGKPHNWERCSVRGGCQCSMCEQDVERWLECAECLTQMNSDHPEFDALWESAAWA